jgi:hypothetical protein
MIRTSRYRSSKRRRAALAVAALAMMAGVVAAVPAFAAPGWVLQTTVNSASGTLNTLDAVSCTSASNCVAVGNYQNSADSYALAEHWNGSTWALQAPVNPSGDTAFFLAGVSCPTATYCIAVGVNQPTVASSTVVAEVWNGSTWALQSAVSPTLAWLSAVSCSATNNCEAVGTDSAGTLAEHWNGSAWSTQTVPAAVKGLSAVDCVSATFCEATSGSAEAASWNGSTWSAQTMQPGTIFAVACGSASSCEAVGYSYIDREGYSLAEHWNGSTWADQTIASPGSGASLDAVSCPSATSCTAAGVYTTTTGDGNGLTLVDYWNGSTWVQQSTPNPSGTLQEADFQGISCPTTAVCTAVGDWYATSPSLARTLGEQN